MKPIFAILALIAACSQAHARCDTEWQPPWVFHTQEGDMRRAAECKLWDQKKIERAYKLLKGKYTRAQIITWEMNEGKFKSAEALADWIKNGDR